MIQKEKDKITRLGRQLNEREYNQKMREMDAFFGGFYDTGNIIMGVLGVIMAICFILLMFALILK